MTKTTQETIYLKDYQPAAFNVDAVFLNFDLQEAFTTVKAVLHLVRNPKARADAPLQLHGEDLALLSVSMDGIAMDASQYNVDENFLTIDNMPASCVLETEVRIKPQENTTLMGLFKSRNNYCTQCESQGFRRITYFFDRPDVMTKFTTTITADKEKYPSLLSNGNLIEKRDLADGRHWVHWEDPSLKPCYLFALVAGDFDLLTDNFTTMSGRDVKLELFVEKGFLHQTEYAMASLKRAMTWDETRWGCEYDLDIYMIVAVSDFNMGAMENKGLNVFNTKYVLAQPETATDLDYKGIEGVIGHEYFHNWTGNRVTCRDWFQITLKEGLTVFRDQEFTADMTSRGVARLDAINVIRDRQFLEDSGPLAHPIRPASYIEINNFYTVTVYYKGAEIIRMVETLITPEKFRKGMDLYFERHDEQAVTTEEFLSAMEDASGHDLTQFRHWYHQAGTPELAVESDYDADKQTYALTVTQSCRPTAECQDKQPFYMPLVVGLVSSDKNSAAADSKVLVISKPTETFTFENITSEPIPSLLRNFSAPVHVHYDYTDEQLAHLFAHDTDAFARWNAGQQLASRVILSISRQETNVVSPLLIDAFKSLLTTDTDDLSFLSKLLTLPSETYLHHSLDKVNVHPIAKARQFCKTVLAKTLKAEWAACYERFHAVGDYVYDAVEVGKRSIKNTCLHYLVATDDSVERQRAFLQFEQANNMTDRLAALSALNHTECEEREKALVLFYEQWRDDPLVVNKWLSMQSCSDLPNTYDRVIALMSHDAFDLHNPNNVYALLCGFGANLSHFHEESGQGYKFIADQVIYLNQKNPQVAGRLLQPLTHWERFEQPYADLMRAELERIAKAKDLSSDIYELVVKSLADS